MKFFIDTANLNEIREAASLGSDEYRAAAEEVARIEVQIARIEEPQAPA